MFNIISHQETETENNFEFAFHPSHNGYYHTIIDPETPRRKWEKRNCLSLLVSRKAGTTTVEIYMKIPQKMGIELPYNLVIYFIPDIYPKDNVLLRYSAAMFIATLSQ